MTKRDLKRKLLKYFKYEDSSLLEILDEGSEKANDRGGYTGVTIEYIVNYILKNKIKKKVLYNTLKKLIINKYIHILSCGDINKNVFEKYKSDENYTRSSLYGQLKKLDFEINKL
jgi:hypothetical protein